MPTEVPPESFEITTTAQVERTYTVLAKDEDQARARLRSFLKDSDSIREGVVVEQTDKQNDTTGQKITADGVKKVAKPRAVEPVKDATG